MVRADATVDAGELYSVAAALGMTDQQVRLCIKRMVADKQFTQEGRGRRAILQPTEDTRRSIEPDVEFLRYMYQQDRGAAPWDGNWHLVAFAVPEKARTARDSLRDTIVHLGGAPIQGGLYVSANHWEPRIEDAATQLDVLDHLTFFTTSELRTGRTDTPTEVAARLWPLDAIAAGHQRLIDVAQRRLDRLRGGGLTHTELLTITIELAAEFTRAMSPDPLLPAELLPQPWSGTQARTLVADCWSHLLRTNTPATSRRLFRTYSDVIREVTDG
ncbi:transcriptional regulator [Rhodococcus sp. SRB_17]|nr:transcriptional regulator [Rhodococcus sp. SRB_17]